LAARGGCRRREKKEEQAVMARWVLDIDTQHCIFRGL
jgi:hypothetical protein